MKKGIKLAGNLSLLLFTILMCLFLGELITRFLIDSKNILNLTIPPVVKDTELVYRNQPNWKGKLNYSPEGFYKVKINSLGLNERELSLKKKKDTYRILFIGDSITFGMGVDTDKTFVRIVESLLNFHLSFTPMLSGVRRVETINGGVAGYYTWQEIAFLRTIGLKYTPNIVVLDFYLNDIEPFESEQEIKKFRENQFPSFQFKYEIPLPFKKVLKEKSRLYWIVSKLYYLMVTKATKLSPFSQTSCVSNSQEQESLSFEHWKTERNDFLHLTYLNRFDWGTPWNSSAYYNNFKKHIRELKDLAQKEDFELVILFIPVEYQLETTFLEDEPQKQLTDIAKSEDVKFIDLLPIMRDYKNSDGLYFDWCHLTEKGHIFVAKQVNEFLKNNL